MCLGTSGRLARSLATTYIFARVRIIGTLVPFCVIGNFKEFPITRNNSQPKVSRIRYSQRFQPAVLSSQPLVFFLALCFC